jgi:hypothetical protein
VEVPSNSLDRDRWKQGLPVSSGWELLLLPETAGGRRVLFSLGSAGPDGVVAVARSITEPEESSSVASNRTLEGWVVEALGALGGKSSVIPVCKWIWEHHQEDLQTAGDLFYTWQYDVRWAVDKLRRDGTVRPSASSGRGCWELAEN